MRPRRQNPVQRVRHILNADAYVLHIFIAADVVSLVVIADALLEHLLRFPVKFLDIRRRQDRHPIRGRQLPELLDHRRHRQRFRLLLLLLVLIDEDLRRIKVILGKAQKSEIIKYCPERIIGLPASRRIPRPASRRFPRPASRRIPGPASGSIPRHVARRIPGPVPRSFFRPQDPTRDRNSDRIAKLLPAPERPALRENRLPEALLVRMVVDPVRDKPQILHIRIPVQILGDRVVDLQDSFLSPHVDLRRLPVQQLLRRRCHIGRVDSPPAGKLLRRIIYFVQNSVAYLFSVQGHASRIGEKRLQSRSGIDNVGSDYLFVLLQHIAESLFIPDRPDRDPSLLGECLSPHRFVLQYHVAQKVVRPAQDQLDIIVAAAGEHPADAYETAGQIRIPLALSHDALEFIEHEPELRVLRDKLLIHLVVPVADAHAVIRQDLDDLFEKLLRILPGRRPSDPGPHICHALDDRLHKQILRHLLIVVKRHFFAGVREVLHVIRVLAHTAFAAEQDRDYVAFVFGQIISDPDHDRRLADPRRAVNNRHAAWNDIRKILLDILPAKEHVRIRDRALVVDIVPVKPPHFQAGVSAPDGQCFGCAADRFVGIGPDLLPDRQPDRNSLLRGVQREPDPAARDELALQAADAVNDDIVPVHPAFLHEDDRNVLVLERYRALSYIFDHEIDIAVRHRVIFVDNVDPQADSLLQGLAVPADGAEQIVRIYGCAPLALTRRPGSLREPAVALALAAARRPGSLQQPCVMLHLAAARRLLQRLLHLQKSGIPLLIRDLRVEQRGCGSQNILLQLREIQHRMHIFQIAADRVRVPDPALQRDILSQESAKIFPDLIQTALDLTLFIPAGCILPPGRKFPAG